jgi:hypothetical protein
MATRWLDAWGLTRSATAAPGVKFVKAGERAAVAGPCRSKMIRTAGQAGVARLMMAAGPTLVARRDPCLIRGRRDVRSAGGAAVRGGGPAALGPEPVHEAQAIVDALRKNACQRTAGPSGTRHRARSSTDRAPAFEAGGCRFEPCRARHSRSAAKSKRKQESSHHGRAGTSPGGRRRHEEAGMGFKLDLGEIGWAPYAMIGGGFGLGLLVLAIAMFFKHG